MVPRPSGFATSEPCLASSFEYVCTLCTTTGNFPCGGVEKQVLQAVVTSANHHLAEPRATRSDARYFSSSCRKRKEYNELQSYNAQFPWFDALTCGLHYMARGQKSFLAYISSLKSYFSVFFLQVPGTGKIYFLILLFFFRTNLDRTLSKRQI